MLLKITKIKEFGIFKNFSWDTTINTFKKRNLIYGWNYSGKTTFSKLFCNLENKNKVHFPLSEFTVQIERQSETFTQDQLETFPYLVKVFNSSYAKGIFSWDNEHTDGFQPILFYLGDEAGDIQPKIDGLKNRWYPKIEAIQKKNETVVSEFEEYAKDSGKFSKQATIVRGYLNDQIKSSEFNKSHFILLVNEVKGDLPKYTLSPDKAAETRQQAIATNEFLQQSTIFNLSEDISKIGNTVKGILEDTAPKSVPIPELDEDKNVFNWVQTGLEIHKGADKCKFCESELKDERIKLLNEYYSDKLQEIQEAIRKVLEEIEADRQGLNFDFPHESDIANHLRGKFRKGVKDYMAKRAIYVAELEKFKSDLIRKSGSLFTVIKATAFNVITVDSEFQNVLAIIIEHNSFVDKFEDRKKEARNLIQRHYVAIYLTAEDYIKKEFNSAIALGLVNRCKSKLQDQTIEIAKLESHLKNTVKGQEELNIYLKIFLNRDDIKIDIINDKFVLKRGLHPATNLSEGEKTAIAFAYFLTELKSLQKEKKLKDTIIFFDDPISSLDSNHVFQVRSLLQFFFAKADDYLQLFIATHSFEFFSVMLDSALFRNENTSDIKAEKCPYYLINRSTADTSVIKNLPKSLRSHKSEYAHIFAILKEYSELTDKELFEFKILLPNALRRFLELYTMFKFPKGFCEIDERMKEIFSPEDGIFHNTKLYHWFSHQNQFEKVAQHDSKLDLIDEAISEVIEHIKENDALHWKGLTSNR